MSDKKSSTTKATKSTSNVWTELFRKNYKWSDDICLYIGDGFYDKNKTIPLDVDAKYDYWYQNFLVRLMAEYSKRVLFDLSNSIDNPPEKYSDLVSKLKGKGLERNLIWHDIYLVISEPTNGKSIANIYKGRNK